MALLRLAEAPPPLQWSCEAARTVAPGAALGRFTGPLRGAPGVHTLCVGPGMHAEGARDAPLTFLNHACAPNAAFVFEAPPFPELRAVAGIAAGAPVTFKCVWGPGAVAGGPRGLTPIPRPRSYSTSAGGLRGGRSS